MKINRIIVGSLGTNCYLIADESNGNATVIDPGAQADKILSVSEGKNYRITRIILTHGHFDHISAVNELIEKTDADILVHRLDSPMLTEPKLNLSSRFRDEYAVKKAASRLLEDGDSVEIGGINFRVLHTPGHTPGSICLIGNDTIFTGDTVFRGGIGRYDFPGGDYREIMKSVKKIARLEGDYKLLPGHDAPTTLSHEKETSIYFN